MSYVSFTDKELKEAKIQRSLGSEPEKRAPVPAKGWSKGVSGNPEGRPKGSKNKATLIKQALMAESEGILIENAPKVIKVVVEQALKGCTKSQKLVWDSIIPSKKSIEVTGREGEDQVIKIVVEGMLPQGETIDAEYEEFSEEDGSTSEIQVNNSTGQN